MARQVSVTEAARLLGVSRRTIERRVKDGTLTVTRDGRRRLVALPEGASTVTEDGTDTTEARLSQTLAQCAELSAECAVLRQRVADVTTDRDYLRSALAAALTLQQKALPERTEQRAAWWQFWRREG